MATSALAHVALAVVAVGGHGVGVTARPVPGEIEVSVDVAPPPVQVAEEESKPSADIPAHRDHVLPSHTHPYAVSPDHDAHPHDPSIDHRLATHSSPESAPETANVAAAIMATEEPATPHFAMVLGRSAEWAGGAAQSAGVTSGAGVGAEVAEGALPESLVSVPAHLLSSVRPEYPSAARASEMEAYVALEIVVDRGGAVTDAHVTRTAGFGFDESALAAVRRFHFSPALRAGAPVRVRMRWTVDFRLE